MAITVDQPQKQVAISIEEILAASNNPAFLNEDIEEPIFDVSDIISSEELAN